MDENELLTNVFLAIKCVEWRSMREKEGQIQSPIRFDVSVTRNENLMKTMESEDKKQTHYAYTLDEENCYFLLPI